MTQRARRRITGRVRRGQVTGGVRPGRGSQVLPLVLLAGCASPTFNLPSPQSVQPETRPSPPPSHEVAEPSEPGLLAGFGRADITPPPGLGLHGYGPSSEHARGYRMRLYARAIVLEDRIGERMAFVVVDLGQVSFVLHREVALRVADSTGLGADRIFLSATHTHSAPSHHFSRRPYNSWGSSVQGYDPAVVEFLVGRIARAVMDASRSLSPAVVGWAQTPVWGFTRNRSYPAYLQNPDIEENSAVPPSGLSLEAEERAVDPTWTLLRVDTVAASGDTAPAAALSIFAMHQTGNPPANDLYDADIAGLVERGLERHIDSLNLIGAVAVPRALHLMANGAEGDVSPAWPPETRCPPLTIRRARRPGGPKTPAGPDEWFSSWRYPGSPCLAASRAFVVTTGTGLTARAVEIYEQLGSSLSGDVLLTRSFETIALAGPAAAPGLCEKAYTGASMPGGAEDGRSSLYRWKFMTFFSLPYEEGNRAVDRGGTTCQAPKRVYPNRTMAGWVIGAEGLPEDMQLIVVRIGDLLLAGISFEATTMAGLRMRRVMLERAHALGLVIEGTAVVSLTNGYVQYVATAEEYGAQHYEGGATLYGPGTAAMIEGRLGHLVEQIAEGGGATIGEIESRPGKPKSLLPEPRPTTLRRPRLDRVGCARDTVIVRWKDAPPGGIDLARGPVLRFERRRSADSVLVAWDGDPHMEVRALSERGDEALWEARWAPAGAAAGDYTMTLLRWPPPDNEIEFACE